MNRKLYPCPWPVLSAAHLFKVCFQVNIIAAILTGCATQRPPQPTPPTAIPAPSAAAPAPVPPPVTQPVVPAVPAPPAIVVQPLPAPPSKTSILRSWIEQQERLYRVAAPILINNTELCPQHARKLLGFTAKTRYSYTDELADVARSELGLEERMKVMSVLPGSGADQAGLQKGDILIAVEIEPLPQGPNAERAGAALIASELQGRDSVRLSVERNGERTGVSIPPTPACGMIIDLGNTDQVNSFSDGQRVMVTRGMFGFVQSDDELAYVLAREIAHNALQPQTRPETATVIERLHTLSSPQAAAAPDGSAPPSSPQAQLAADRLALYMLARSGYALEPAIEFWKRLALAPETANGYAPSHPLTEEDVNRLTDTIATIRKKQQSGEPLVPEQL